MRAAVLAHGADLGLAHDGDADRCLAVDAAGEVVDGDAIMVDAGAGDAGGRRAGRQHAGGHGDEQPRAAPGDARRPASTVRTTGVGDRYVLEELRAGEYSLGGEQSGHIVMPALGTTGDGIVTGLRLMSRMAQTGSSLADLAARDADAAAGADQRRGRRQGRPPPPRRRCAPRSQQAEAELGDTGRILLRPSGTEQMVRVMVEADDEGIARRLATRVAETVRAQH